MKPAELRHNGLRTHLTREAWRLLVRAALIQRCAYCSRGYSKTVYHITQMPFSLRTPTVVDVVVDYLEALW